MCALYGQAVPKKGGWPVYGGDAGAMRYSPLDQIKTTNVTGLRRAWTYHTGEHGRAFEVTPIMVDNVLYLKIRVDRAHVACAARAP